MGISLCIMARDEEAYIGNTIMCIRDYVDEVLVVDDHSKDKTKEIAKSNGARVLDLPFRLSDEGFSKSRNWMLDNASEEWILMIDADELLDQPDRINHLIDQSDIDIWALPRRKWRDYHGEIRTEYDAYPDWQIRLFRNIPDNRWEGELHEHFKGTPIHYAYVGPHIEHLQEECRTDKKLKQRLNVYTKLSIIQGVAVHGGHVLPRSQLRNV